MKHHHKYIAKLYLGDGETLIQSGDDVDQLTTWMNNQAEASFDDMNGEIIESMSERIIKKFQYEPPLRE